MWPARIFGYVSSDRARLGARRIRCKIKARVFHRPGDVQIYHARLHDRPLVLHINLNDPVHAREDDHHATAAGQRATGKSCSRASSHNGHFILCCQFDDLGDFFGRVRENHQIGPTFFDGPVKFVQQQVFLFVQNVFLAQKRLYFAQQRGGYGYTRWAHNFTIVTHATCWQGLPSFHPELC